MSFIGVGNRSKSVWKKNGTGTSQHEHDLPPYPHLLAGIMQSFSCLVADAAIELWAGSRMGARSSSSQDERYPHIYHHHAPVALRFAMYSRRYALRLDLASLLTASGLLTLLTDFALLTPSSTPLLTR